MKYWFGLLFVFCTASTLCGQTTYAEHIQPILRAHCTSCHNDTEIGPMPLLDYEDVVSYGQMIAYVTRTGLMPPFRAKEPMHSFEGENILSESEINSIRQWVEEGMPKGTMHAASENMAEKKQQSLQRVDAVVSMQEAFEQYGIYYDQYRVFVLPTDFEEDKFVRAVNFVPGNRKIVRQLMVSVDTSAHADAWDEWDPKYGYFSFGGVGFTPLESRWFSWNPTEGAKYFAENASLFLPKGAKLLLHIHYGPTGVPASDSSYLELQFADSFPTHVIRTLPLINPSNMTNDTFVIPAGQTVRYHAKFELPYDIVLTGIFPHAHFLARTWDIFATPPDAHKAERLLKIDDWDYHWKQRFTFQTPKILKKGTVIHALASYDNTTENLANPSDPPRDMHWGEGMYDEMFMVYFSFYQHTHTQHSTAFQMYPVSANQYADSIHVKYRTDSRTKLSLEICTLDQQECHHIFLNTVHKKGDHSVSIPTGHLKAGNYFIRLSDHKTAVCQALCKFENQSEFQR